MLLLSFPSYFLVLCFITCDYLSLPVDLSARSFTTLQYLSNTSYAYLLPSRPPALFPSHVPVYHHDYVYLALTVCSELADTLESRLWILP